MNKYEGFRNREIDFSRPVRIYKNLHNGLFSVQQNGLVRAHLKTFKLNQVTFSVNEAGRQRVINEKKKNVHAFILGMLQEVNAPYEIKPYLVKIKYNPYLRGEFYYPIDGETAEMHPSENVIGTPEGLFVY